MLMEINVIREQVKVRLRQADDTFVVKEFAVDDVRIPGPEDAAAVREAPKNLSTAQFLEKMQGEKAPEKPREPGQGRKNRRKEGQSGTAMPPAPASTETPAAAKINPEKNVE